MRTCCLACTCLLYSRVNPYSWLSCLVGIDLYSRHWRHTGCIDQGIYHVLSRKLRRYFLVVVLAEINRLLLRNIKTRFRFWFFFLQMNEVNDCKRGCLRIQALTLAGTKMTVFGMFAPRGLAEVDRCFRDAYCSCNLWNVCQFLWDCTGLTTPKTGHPQVGFCSSTILQISIKLYVDCTTNLISVISLHTSWTKSCGRVVHILHYFLEVPDSNLIPETGDPYWGVLVVFHCPIRRC
jgi:hypothetical protein